ncbi:BppU family phage baseplate upper protein [Natrinema soli]|uniref:BppU family phage baseplate upper protein n=1 Tax=Natrinema soli TaxID=1930624 RepID=A0ABD5SNC0_9EURY|nr:BppU family phage baseplate upper protein [Natrinema soli]
MSTHTRPDYVRNRGDSYLPLEATFRTEPDRPTGDGDPLDLSDALSVRFYLEHPDRDEVIVNDSAEVDDPATGAVSYQLDKHQLSRTGTHAGLFIARFEGEQQWSAPRGGRVIRIEVEDIPDADGEPIDLEKVDVSIGVLEADEVISDSGTFGALSLTGSSGSSDWGFNYDSGSVNVTKNNSTYMSFTDSGVEVPNAPAAEDHIARQADLGSGWSPAEWNEIDVSEHGFPGDESGGDVVQFMLDNPNNKFIFPEGRYSCSQQFNPDSTWSQFAIEGKGDGATFVCDTTDMTNNKAFFVVGQYDTSNIDRAEIKNVNCEIDATNGYNFGFGIFAVNDFLEITNCRLNGERRYYEYGGSKYGIRVNMLNDHSVAFINGLYLGDGDAGNVSTNFDGCIGASVEPPNKGTIFWNGCQVSGWPDNGMYLKDGTGRSLAMGCMTANNGNQNIRLGKGDMAIGGWTAWTVDPSTVDYAGGVCLEIEHGQGSAVIGYRVEADYAATDVMRTRGENEHVKFQDVYIRNNSAQLSIDCSSSSGETTESEPGGEGYATLDNVRIVNDHSGTSAIRSATVRTTRVNTVFRGCSIKTRNPNIGVAPVRVNAGDASFQDCRFHQHADSQASYTAIIGPGDSTATDIGNIQFTRCKFVGTDGPYLYGGDQIPFLEFVGCDFSQISGSLWPAVSPQAEYEAGNITEFSFFRNRPYTEGTNYGSISQKEVRADTAYANEGGGKGFQIVTAGGASRFTRRNNRTTIDNTYGDGFMLRYVDDTGTSSPLIMDPDGTTTISGRLTLGGGLNIEDRLNMLGNSAINAADMQFDPVAEPSAPTEGWKLFVDSADGGLKAKDDTGAVTTIATK